MGSQVYAYNVVYQADRSLKSVGYGNSFALTNSYNSHKLLTRIEVKDATQTTVDLEYAHDDNGRVVSINDRSALSKVLYFDGVVAV